MLLRLPNVVARRMFIILVLMVIVGLFYIYSSENKYHSCFMEGQVLATQQALTADGETNLLDDVLQADPKPSPGNSIFFHETSCRLSENRQLETLKVTARQACAIESAAMHNPNFQVFVLFAGPTYRISNNNSHPQPLVEAILSYSNVHLRRLNLESYASDICSRTYQTFSATSPSIGMAVFIWTWMWWCYATWRRCRPITRVLSPTPIWQLAL
ncbi:uncharacterized protein LOC6613189 isoform X2 [Drosophila sechellia]|uniref:uncharacterized protein LOC6613189 isoform X2 n=1 Tax=Drosophila sechellia TaxID=7238 RepID=UPI0013DD90BE|nr:uncharacterized protein LOC6613189 isoform X2 [Drosophila sechellia]